MKDGIVSTILQWIAIIAMYVIMIYITSNPKVKSWMDVVVLPPKIPMTYEGTYHRYTNCCDGYTCYDAFGVGHRDYHCNNNIGFMMQDFHYPLWHMRSQHVCPPKCH
jgi:hypothetical protein